MLQQKLRDFFTNVDPLVHAGNVLGQLQDNLPLIRTYPNITLPEIWRFRHYLDRAPTHNVHPALKCLKLLAREVPETRDQIIEDVGDLLYEYAGIPGFTFASTLHKLLEILQLPVSPRDELMRSLARSLTCLRQPAIVVIGAGFSYDTMPITAELAPLLISVLRSAGIPNPAHFITTDDRQVWQIVERQESDFKRLFIGWCARSTPSFQHTMLCRLLREGLLSHIISFNWDDLCERAHLDLTGQPIPKVTTGGTPAHGPSLWKLHGDVETPHDPWIFPYESGRVFDSLIQSLDEKLAEDPPHYALIVGYSEWEPQVKDRLIGWLEEYVPSVVRVRPNWPEDNDQGIPDSAKRFFQRLNAYMSIAKRDVIEPIKDQGA